MQCKYEISERLTPTGAASGWQQLRVLPEADWCSALSCGAPSHLSALSGRFLIGILKSMNSNCDQQVDIDWINTIHWYERKTYRFLCDLTALNRSKDNRHWNNIIMMPFEKPEFMLCQICWPDDKETTLKMVVLWMEGSCQAGQEVSGQAGIPRLAAPIENCCFDWWCPKFMY